MNQLTILLIELFKSIFIAKVKDREKNYTYMYIFKRAITLANYLNMASRKPIRIALIANNSINWIIVFLAVIFSKHQLVLFSRNNTITKIKKIISDSKSTFVITDITLYEIKNSCPFVRVIIEIEDIINIDEDILTDSLDIEDFSQQSILTYTPNKLKEVEITYDHIIELCSKLSKEKDLFDATNTFVLNQELCYNYVLCLLLPLLAGVDIIISETNIEGKGLFKTIDNIQAHQPEIVILTGYQFEVIWRQFIEPSDNKFIRLLIDFKWKKLRRWFLKKNLNFYFPNIKSLIILNSSISYEKEELLKSIKFPYTITYGTVETCGIATYSNPKNFVINSCGEVINITNSLIEQNERLRIMNNGQIEELDDRGIIKQRTNNTLFFFNRTDETIETEYGFIITRDIEKILKSLPLITDCVLFLIKDRELSLLVNLDVNLIDSQSLKIKEIQEILKEMITEINKKVYSFQKIENVYIDFTKFQRDHYGRIKRDLYTIQ